MNASNLLPLHPHWDADALADAVPLRLFELLDFDAPDGAARGVATVPVPRAWHGAYRVASPWPDFMRVRS